MPYQAGINLPGELASKTGHLDIIKNPFVQNLIKEFHSNNPIASISHVSWENIPDDGKPLHVVFAVDGSYQTILSDTNPPKELSFVKTALLRLDEHAIEKLDKENPHPLALRDILRDSALHHATVFPLKHVTIPGMSVYHCIRKIIYDSLRYDPLNGEPYETLKWLAYEKWSVNKNPLKEFQCPHCHEVKATLEYNEDKGECPQCHNEIFLTDWLGLHLDLLQENDSAPEKIANYYMLLHEILLLFTGIRYYWENDKNFLSDCLFIKDGPLSIRANYSKLVAPIRRFLKYAYKEKYPIYVIGQEKTGNFVDHLYAIIKNVADNSFFIPNNEYIHNNILQQPQYDKPYGWYHIYGSKVLMKMNDYHYTVLNIPTGDYVENPTSNDLIGFKEICATLPRLLSYRHEGALIPIELANGIASLSTYPSAQILKLFAESKTS